MLGLLAALAGCRWVAAEPEVPDLAVMQAACAEVASELAFEPALRGWSWVRERPGGWGLVQGGLHLRTDPGTIWGGDNDGVNLLLRDLPAGEAWCVQVSVDHGGQQHPEQAGLVLYGGDDDWVKLVMEVVDGGTAAIQATEHGGQAAVDRGAWAGARPWRLRLVREGGRLLGFAQGGADGGEGWVPVGVSAMSESGESSEARIGLMSQGGPEGNLRSARFEGFEFRAPRPSDH